VWRSAAESYVPGHAQIAGNAAMGDGAGRNREWTEQTIDLTAF